MQEIQLDRRGDLVVVEIQASGFLYGMVRLLMAQLVAVGEHRQTVAQFEERWQKRRRSEVKEAAPARGLCLLRAGYREPIFSQSSSYDSQPQFLLNDSDPPPDPPPLPDSR